MPLFFRDIKAEVAKMREETEKMREDEEKIRESHIRAFLATISAETHPAKTSRH